MKSDGYIRKSRFPKKRVSNPPRSIQTKALLGQRGILFFVFFFQITNGSGRQLMKKVDLLADQLQVHKKNILRNKKERKNGRKDFFKKSSSNFKRLTNNRKYLIIYAR